MVLDSTPPYPCINRSLSQLQLICIEQFQLLVFSELSLPKPYLDLFEDEQVYHQIYYRSLLPLPQIQWLLENYETAEGVSLPRSTLYNHYLRHCAANKIDAVNAASFGKLIRSVYIGLKTRRLGTRYNLQS